MTGEDKTLVLLAAIVDGYDASIIKLALVDFKFKSLDHIRDVSSESRAANDRILSIRALLDRIDRIDQMLEVL